MVAVFVWNGLDKLFILNFDLKLIISQGYKRQIVFNIMPLMVPFHTQPINVWKIWMKLDFIYVWIKHYDFGNVSILRIAMYIWGTLAVHDIL